MNIEPVKNCINGHQLGEWGRDTDGHCKGCRKVRKRKYYLANKNRILKLCHVYSLTHKKTINATRRRWTAKNPGKVRTYALKHIFKIEPSAYEELLRKQSYGCAICQTKTPGQKARKFFCVDHAHGCCTNRRGCQKCRRGLLCDNCNKGLGHFRDKEELLMKAAKYLKCYPGAPK